MEVELSLYLNHFKYKSAINYRQYTVKVFTSLNTKCVYACTHTTITPFMHDLDIACKNVLISHNFMMHANACCTCNLKSTCIIILCTAMCNLELRGRSKKLWALKDAKRAPSSSLWISELGLTIQDKAIISSHDWLSDNHIQAAQTLLIQQFPCIGGLESPVVVANLSANIVLKESFHIEL